MIKKNIIRLTESEFKHVITETIKNIFESYGNGNRTERFDLQLYDVDAFEDQELEKYFEDANVPDTVDVSLTVYEEPYDPGDYWTPPSGGERNFVNCEVDIDGKFKTILPESLYQIFIDEIESYLESNYDEYMDKIPYDNWNYNECDDDY